MSSLTIAPPSQAHFNSHPSRPSPATANATGLLNAVTSLLAQGSSALSSSSSSSLSSTITSSGDLLPALEELKITEAQVEKAAAVKMEKILHVWDTGGQDIYQISNELFFTPGSFPIVVFSLVELNKETDLTTIISWITRMHSALPRSPFLIVGTHYDICGDDLVKHFSYLIGQELNKYPSIISQLIMNGHLFFFPVSNSNNNNGSTVDRMGIPALQRAMKEVIFHHPALHRFCPLPWFQILDDVVLIGQDMRRPAEELIMSMEVFSKEIAGKHGVVGAKEVEEVAVWLNQVGFAVYFSNIDHICLSPQLFIDAVSAVINITVTINDNVSDPSSPALRADLDYFNLTGIIHETTLRELWHRNLRITQPSVQELFLRFFLRLHLAVQLAPNTPKAQPKYVIPAKIMDPRLPPEHAPRIHSLPQTAYLRLVDVASSLSSSLEVLVDCQTTFLRLLAKFKTANQLTSPTFKDAISRTEAFFAVASSVVLITLELPRKRIRFDTDAIPISSMLYLIKVFAEEIIRDQHQSSEVLPKLSVLVSRTNAGDPHGLLLDLNQIEQAVEKGQSLFNNRVPIPMDLLRPFAPPGLDPVNRYDMFIGYRVNPDQIRAIFLYYSLRSHSEQALNIFLDKFSLPTGQPWGLEFARGLSQSNVFLPIITQASLAVVASKLAAGEVDNVVVEWSMALFLHTRGEIKTIVPVFESESMFYGKELAQISAKLNGANRKSNEKVVEYLKELKIPLSEQENASLMNSTVSDIYVGLCNFQNIGGLDTFAVMPSSSPTPSVSPSSQFDWKMYIPIFLITPEFTYIVMY